MKKRTMRMFLAIAMIAALLVGVAGCGSNNSEAEEKIAALEQENAELRQQVAALTEQLNSIPVETTLDTWTLTAAPFEDNSGATVEFKATPVEYVEDAVITLSVELNGMEAESVECTWNGSAYVADIDLTAADGYSYYCILSSSDGSQEIMALNTPSNPTDESLIYLSSSLISYANVVLDAWENTDKALTLKSGYIQVQTPQLSGNGETVSLEKAALVLKLNDEEKARKDLQMPAGESAGSYELTLEDVTFDMPKMKDDDQLDLWLEVTLSNGEAITSNGGSWFYSDDALNLMVG